MDMLEWKRSSKCSTDKCLEILVSDREVFIRNSKNPDLILLTNTEELTQFAKDYLEGNYG